MDEMIEKILVEEFKIISDMAVDELRFNAKQVAHLIHQAYLDAGYIKLSDKQELPIRFLHPDDKPNISYGKAQQDMLKCNFRRVML